jgi:hypothetical protein
MNGSFEIVYRTDVTKSCFEVCRPGLPRVTFPFAFSPRAQSFADLIAGRDKMRCIYGGTNTFVRRIDGEYELENATIDDRFEEFLEIIYQVCRGKCFPPHEFSLSFKKGMVTINDCGHYWPAKKKFLNELVF